MTILTADEAHQENMVEVNHSISGEVDKIKSRLLMGGLAIAILLNILLFRVLPLSAWTEAMVNLILGVAENGRQTFGINFVVYILILSVSLEGLSRALRVKFTFPESQIDIADRTLKNAQVAWIGWILFQFNLGWTYSDPDAAQRTTVSFTYHWGSISVLTLTFLSSAMLSTLAYLAPAL